MFEKEAEEFVDSKKSFWRQGRTCIDSVRQAYQKGAEFGYNKAMNEATGIIKDLLHCLPRENIRQICADNEE